MDIIASPTMRDNILLAGLNDEQEEELCYGLHTNGFTIWGSQPWNPMGWEISQEFLEKWEGIVDEETIKCSNFWRFERGEGPLEWGVGGGVLGEVF